MSFWVLVWTTVFVVTLIVYVGLVCVVTVGGWQDIRSMFRDLEDQDPSAEEDN